MKPKNNVEIVPYSTVDGIPTYGDAYIMSLYYKIIEDGHGHIFNDGTIFNEDDFLRVMKDSGTILYLVYYKEELAGLVWLNRFESRIARCHLCTFHGFSIVEKIAYGKTAMKLLINQKLNNEYVFDAFIGYLPEGNVKAEDYVVACGAQVAGHVPKLLWDVTKGESVPGNIIYFDRGE